ncbi:MAG: hypothetical protein J6T32_01235 [Paludibacteraceae bacterium]|nr:hypothetical protein [Paludibacteraceae bacterium]
MRKLFTLFVALMAVVSLSAKKIYLIPNDDWKSFGAVFFVHSWGGAADGDAKLVAVEGDENAFFAEIPDDNNNLLFVRAQGDSESIPWESENLWNKTADLEIPEGKDCFRITGWETGEWMKYGEVILPEVAIVGNFGEDTWGPVYKMTPAEDKLTASVTIENLTAATYEMKVWVDGDYLSLNGADDTMYRIHRGWDHADNVNLVNDGKNFEFVADVTGDYTFTWTYESHNLVVAFPAASPTECVNASANVKTVKRIANGQIVIIRDGVQYNALGAEMR